MIVRTSLGETQPASKFENAMTALQIAAAAIGALMIYAAFKGRR